MKKLLLLTICLFAFPACAEQPITEDLSITAPYEPPNPEERPLVRALARFGQGLGVLAIRLEKCKQSFKKIKLQRKKRWLRPSREMPTEAPRFTPHPKKQDDTGPHCPD